jgi:hypothetical protein
VFKGMDLVSSSPLMPARLVQSFKAGVQDAGGVAAYFKKQVVGDGNVVENAAEVVAFASETAQSGFSLDMALGAMGGVGGRNKSRGKHHDESPGSGGASCPVRRPNSFDPNTPVLMADGSRKPIKDVQLGDRVLATDPTTGRMEAREVTDVRSHASQRTLVELTIGTDTGAGTVVATDEHPFWVASDKRWSNAIDLKPGHNLATADNRDATITGTRTWSETRRVYNLTIDTTHTYYVLVGSAPILVHNDDEAQWDGCYDPSGNDYLYRGVEFGHPGYNDALSGKAKPRGGSASVADHNGGIDTDSPYTSWTTDYEGVAVPESEEGNGPGAVLRIPNADGNGYKRVPSPDVYDESEVLIEGVVGDADVSINRKPWIPGRPRRK